MWGVSDDWIDSEIEACDAYPCEHSRQLRSALRELRARRYDAEHPARIWFRGLLAGLMLAGLMGLLYVYWARG